MLRFALKSSRPIGAQLTRTGSHVAPRSRSGPRKLIAANMSGANLSNGGYVLRNLRNARDTSRSPLPIRIAWLGSGIVTTIEAE